MVWGYGDLPDLVTLQEEVGSFLVLCTTVFYHTFQGPKPANYLLVQEVGYCNTGRSTLTPNQ